MSGYICYQSHVLQSSTLHIWQPEAAWAEVGRSFCQWAHPSIFPLLLYLITQVCHSECQSSIANTSANMQLTHQTWWGASVSEDVSIKSKKQRQDVEYINERTQKKNQGTFSVLLITLSESPGCCTGHFLHSPVHRSSAILFNFVSSPAVTVTQLA